MSWTARPARLTDRTTLWIEVIAPVTMWTSTSRRTPVMPTGSRIPSCSSTTNVCGNTWMISRSWGRLMARAASIARWTSTTETSRSLFPTATTPRLLTPRMWPPAMPAYTPDTSTPAICSASPTAWRIASTVASMFTTTPLRRPRDGAVPTPTTSMPPLAFGSAMTAQIFVVPTSSPTTYSLSPLRAIPGLPSSGRPDREAQIDRGAPLARAPDLLEHAGEPGQPFLPLLGAQPDLDAIDGVEDRALAAAHVDLGDLADERAARSQERADERERRA